MYIDTDICIYIYTYILYVCVYRYIHNCIAIFTLCAHRYTLHIWLCMHTQHLRCTSVCICCMYLNCCDRCCYTLGHFKSQTKSNPTWACTASHPTHLNQPSYTHPPRTMKLVNALCNDNCTHMVQHTAARTAMHHTLVANCGQNGCAKYHVYFSTYI